jgi:uncharacterized protein YfaP (DUF2135 family)
MIMPNSSPLSLRTLFRGTAAAALIIAIIGYAAYQAKGVTLGPSIHVDQDLNGTSTNEPVITLSGTIRRANAISLNGRPIYVDLEGRFSERFALMPGTNILVITARGADGREVQRTLTVVRTAEHTAITP